MFTTEIKVTGNKLLLEAYYNALDPEQSHATERAKYSLKKGRSALIIAVQAEDATAFRAVLTSLTGLLSIVEKTWKYGKN